MSIIHIVCPSCNAVNRIDEQKSNQNPLCGRCKNALFPHTVMTLNNENFNIHINRSEIPIVVDFWAEWCGPCKMMAPAFEQAASEIGVRIRLAKLNTEQNQLLASQYNIRSIPTLVVFKKGQEISRQSGAMNKQQLLQWLQTF